MIFFKKKRYENTKYKRYDFEKNYKTFLKLKKKKENSFRCNRRQVRSKMGFRDIESPQKY